MCKSYLFAFVFLIGCVFFACRKEWVSADADVLHFSVDSAKLFLKQAHHVVTDQIRFNPRLLDDEESQGQSKNGFVYWNRAIEYPMDDFEVVEVPLILKQRQIPLYNIDNMPVSDEINEERAKSTFSSLLIYKQANQKNSLIITYIPDRNYSRNLKARSKALNLSNAHSFFSGYIEYRNLQGDLLFLVRLIPGKTIRFYRPQEIRSRSLQSISPTNTVSSSEGCTLTCIPVYQTTCAGPIEGRGEETEMVCVRIQVGQKCEIYCTMPVEPIKPTIPVPGGGWQGNENINLAVGTQWRGKLFNKRAKCSSFDSEHERRLDTALADLLTPNLASDNRTCYSRFLFHALESKLPDESQRPSLCVESGRGNGRYSPSENRIYFSSAESIEYKTVLHELTHVLQHLTYSGGIAQYQYSSYAAIEYECFFLMDILTYLADGGMNKIQISKQRPFKTFLDSLTFEGKSISRVADFFDAAKWNVPAPYIDNGRSRRAVYESFMNDFKANNSWYDIGNSIPRDPETLFYMAKHFYPCN